MFRGIRLFFLILVMAIAMGLPYSAVAAQTETVLYMSFDEPPGGGEVLDESGFENHGQILGNGIDWTQKGRFNGALEFDGASKIEIPHSESLNLSKNMTLQIWFKTDVEMQGRFLIYKSHVGGGRNYQWGIYLTGTSSAVSTYVVKPNDEVKTAGHTGVYNDDQWHFLAGTYDGDTVNCYMDGVLNSAAFAGELRTGEAPVYIGAWSNFFTGTLDEVRIVNIALNEDQLKTDFESGYNILAVDAAGKLAARWAEIKSQ